MSKKLITLIAFLMAFSVMKAQFSYSGVFPPPSPDTLKFQTHGLAVDPDGKVWVSSFSKLDSVMVNGVKLLVSALYVYNPDGTPAAFSPIRILTKDGISDTLKGNGRGMGVDKDGNIIHSQSGPNKIFKINYQTGELMARADFGGSPTAAMGDANGNIYVAFVVPGNPLVIFDSNLNVIMNGLDASVGYSRAFGLSNDGLTLYWAGYDKGKIYVYTRASEFDQFALTDSMAEGAKAESFAWDKKNGCLWFSAGSTNDSPTANFTRGSWYGYDFTNKVVVDSFKLNFGTYSPDARPRAIQFSPNGMKAYVGTFGIAGFPAVQVFERPATATVTFNVNMSVQVQNNLFDPTTGKVYVAGSFTDWATSQLEMTDPDGDKVYSVTVSNIEPGTRVFFKYRMNDGWENDPNREFVVNDGGSYGDYYNRDLGGGIPIQLMFACNMELEIVAGRFNPTTGVVTARGNFNGWSDQTVLTPSVGDPNIYEGVANYSVFPGDDIAYKFAYVVDNNTTWENGDNKIYTITQNDVNNGYAVITRSFNDADLSTVTGQATTVKLKVDMTNAKNALTNQPFPTVESVHVCGAVNPLAWPQGGWPDGDITLAIALNDAGTDGDEVAGDNIWSKDIVFPQYTLLNFEFKYGANWGLASNGGGNDNESTMGVNHSITLTTNAQYVIANTVWADMSPAIVVGVETANNEIPTVYNLSQNYPNPFNPSTTINFSVPKAGLVTMKVYNLLGQEVAELVNEQLAAGNYDVNFNASNLTSGVYFYTITSDNFVATKKMMLVK